MGRRRPTGSLPPQVTSLDILRHAAGKSGWTRPPSGRSQAVPSSGGDRPLDACRIPEPDLRRNAAMITQRAQRCPA